MVLFVERVGVVGAGLMGAAIAEVMALNGKQVVLKDVNEDLTKKGMAHVKGILDELVAFHEGKAEAELDRIARLGVELTAKQVEQVRLAKKPTYTKERAAEILAQVKPTTSYKDFENVDIVIEAVVERMDVKKKVFQELEAATPKHVTLASNTSALSISELQSAVKRRQKVVGLHFFNPPYTLPLIEVVPGLETHPGTVDDCINFLGELRNHRFPMLPIKVKETPGFLVNRILGRMLNEAFLCYEEGIAAPRDIDIAMKAGAGLPMGPLELADMVGIDTIAHVQRNMREMGVPESQRMPQIIQQLVHLGRLGKKSGRGFYDYTTEQEM
ncbi:MAG: 3-hydroxyacyl-CoA dehydrogenase family protein [Methanobacteriota archaeon]